MTRVLQASAVRVVATVLLLGGGSGWALAQQAGTPPAVTVVKVEEREITPAVSFTGRIEAKDKVDLRARVEGFLEQRLFEEGQTVEAGQLLFVIEKAPYSGRIETVDAAIARAQATLDLAELERRRQGELVKKQAAAQAKLDDATAKAGEAKADLRRQQANLTTAELDLGYTDIKAPFAGRIGRAAYSVGEFVGPSSGTLATIVSQDPMYVTFPVTQRQLLEVRKERARRWRRPDDQGGQGPAGGWCRSTTRSAGSTSSTCRSTRAPTRSRCARRCRTRTVLLVDGQLVTVIVETAKPEPALLIPQQAVQIDQAGRFVLKVDAENKVQVQRITVGDRARRLLCRDQRPPGGRAGDHRGAAEGPAGHGGRPRRGPRSTGRRMSCGRPGGLRQTRRPELTFHPDHQEVWPPSYSPSSTGNDHGNNDEGRSGSRAGPAVGDR